MTAADEAAEAEASVEAERVRLRDKAAGLLPEASALVVRTPLTPAQSAPAVEGDMARFDRVVQELAGIEKAMSAASFDAGDSSLGAVRTTLGGLYATRCIHRRGSQADRDEGVRLLRSARAAGHVRVEQDPTPALLLAILLMPGITGNLGDGPRSLPELMSVLDVGSQVMNGGPLADDLSEANDLLAEILDARPDDPRLGHLPVMAGALSQMCALGRLSQSGADFDAGALARFAASATTLTAETSGRSKDMMRTLLDMGQALGVTATTGATAPPQPPYQDSEQPAVADDEERARYEIGLLLEALAPGSLDESGLREVVATLDAAGEAGDERALAIAGLGRLLYAARTGRPDDLDDAVRVFRRLAGDQMPGETAWLVRSIFPAALAESGASVGNIQDTQKAAEQLALEWASLSADGALPRPHAPGFESLRVSRAVLHCNIRLGQAAQNDDEEALEALVEELLDMEQATDQSHEMYFLVLYQLAVAEFHLAGRRHDVGGLRRGLSFLRGALETTMPPFARALLDATWPMALSLSALLERQPAQLADAVKRARRSLDATSSVHDQRPRTRAAIAMALKAQRAVSTGADRAALLDEAINDLERARAELSEHTAPSTVNLVLWELADAYQLRGDEESDDLGRAVALTLASLHYVTQDVLLQFGAEHGLQSARAGSGHGLRAAAWAAGRGSIEQAVQCLEVGRALVLRAAAAAKGVPAQLRQIGETRLAEHWEVAVATGRQQLGDEYMSIPSALRRQALDALRTASDALHGLLAVPDIQELSEAVDAAGVDALVYLIPGDGDADGRAIMLLRGGTTAAPALPGLSAAGRGAFERYLDTSARRSKVAQEHGGEAALQSANEAWETALEELCDWAGTAVVDAVLAELPAGPTVEQPGRVVFVACGALGVVPWHAARLPHHPEQFGLTRPVRACDLIVTSYAASGKEFLRAQHRERRPYGDNAAIVADPARRLAYAGPEALALREAYFPDARLLGFILDHPTLAAGTPDEVLSLFVGGDGEPPATLLHIGAHASASTRPTMSRLVLCAPGGDLQGTDEEMALTVVRILDSAEPGVADGLGSLVVLDGCETDLSNRDHDEALTLTTAFVARGACDAVGSRWVVRDWTSAVCTVAFHHFLTTGPLAPADALRAAQRWMLDRDREPIPVLAQGLLRRMRRPLDEVSAWAAFIHQGNTRPLRTGEPA